MERAAIVIAVVVAIVFAAAGAGAFHFHGMNFIAGERASAQERVAPGARAAEVFGASAVKIDDAAAIVRITPSDRGDISIAIENPGRVPMPDVRIAGDAVVINGRLAGRILNCHDDGGVDVLGYGGVEASELPVITILMPKAVDFDAGGAIRAEIGPADSARLDLAGCGDTRIGDVAGALEADGAGSGSLTAGAAGSGSFDVDGSGDFAVGAVAGLVSVDLAGSGSLEIASAQSAAVDIAGSGQVRVRRLAGSVSAEIRGSGDFTVDTGAGTTATVDTMGSGDFDARTLNFDTARIEIMGSGDVRVGRVNGLEASIMGSGDVHAGAGTSIRRQQVMGSGDVIIAN